MSAEARSLFGSYARDASNPRAWAASFVASSAIYVGLAIAAVVLGSAAKKVVRQAAVEVKFVVVPAAVIAVLVLAGVAHAKKFSACPAGRFVVAAADAAPLRGDGGDRSAAGDAAELRRHVGQGTRRKEVHHRDGSLGAMRELRQGPAQGKTAVTRVRHAPGDDQGEEDAGEIVHGGPLDLWGRLPRHGRRRDMRCEIGRAHV